ncbi:MAG: ABC transporter ATP-binding protein [Kiritimatiellia bacterium]|jgi:iron(III) transport system ATP-binding protein|nr:ABC transporter ATP-binding protein [Kiritimatiellia bacterium]
MAVGVEAQEVVKTFGAVRALDQVSVSIHPGELFFLLGPSGCGKTTLLRCLAGFQTPDAGRVFFGARDVTGLPPHARNTGMMFQSYALWPHMTLAENVAFGLEMRKRPRAEIRARVMAALELVHLADRAKARPNLLSGGQQQRVALARALVVEPQCLLLDEPLSNLDAKLRLEMRGEIRRICKAAGTTAVYVTHDRKEALSIADRLAVMRDGRVEQIGTPEEIYRHPASRFVAGFIGEGHFLAGRVETVSETDGVRVATRIGRLQARRAPEGVRVGEEVTVCLRPETLRFGVPPRDGMNRMRGRYRASVYLGEMAQHEIDLGPEGGPCEVLTAFQLNPSGGSDRTGNPAEVWVAPDEVIVTRG